MTTVLAWLFIGVLAGILSYVLLGRRYHEQISKHVSIALFGAMCGGLIFAMFDVDGLSVTQIEGFIISIVGAIVAVTLYLTVRRV